MAKAHFFPDILLEQLVWHQKFANNIGTYASKYGIASGTVTALGNDREYVGFWFGVQVQGQTFAHVTTEYRNEVAFGVKPGHAPSVEPTAPALGTVPTAVAPGVFMRALAVANQIKNHPDYDPTDGKAMGLEGAEDTFDPTTGKPVLTYRHAEGGHPQIHIKKGKFEGFVLYKNSGSGYTRLDSSLHPNYIDHSTLPALGQTAVWKYRAIYLFQGKETGENSEEIAVTVYGAL